MPLSRHFLVEIKSEEQNFPRTYFNDCLNPVTAWNQPLNRHVSQIYGIFLKNVCEEVPFFVKLRSFSCRFPRAYWNTCFVLILLQCRPGFVLVGRGMILPPHQSRCSPNGVASPPKTESLTENEHPIHWNMKSPLQKWFLGKYQKAGNYR